MWLVSARDLQFRARRFVIAVLITSLVFGIALAIDGMRRSMKHEGPAMVALIGADQWVVAAGTTGPFTTTRVIDARDADSLRQESGVKRADPMVISKTVIGAKDPKDANLVGHVLGGLGSPPISEGRAAEKPGEAVLTGGVSAKVGEPIVVGGKTFRVVGKTNKGRYYIGQPGVFVLLQDAQDMSFKGQPFAMGIAVRGATTQVPAGTMAITSAQAVDDINRPMVKGVQMVVVMAALMWLIAAGIIGLIVYLSAIERLRDFAVFKATGAPTRVIVGGIMLQAVFLSLLAALLALGTSRIVGRSMPLPAEMAATGFMQLVVVSVVVGVLASLAGVRRALTTEPAVAFGGN
jgi:putative ABC transport system permease protein